MRFSLEFLKEFVDINVPPQELAQRLTLAGTEVASLKPLDGDWVFEAEITANRPDLLSIWGLGYEVSAILGSRIKFKAYPALASRRDLIIKIENRQDVPFYAGRLIEGVEIKRSPDWLRRRLAGVGMEEINNIVDITNYCLFKWGAPLHAFDADKIMGNVRVRRARRGEKILCLDGKERELAPQDLVIADDRRLLAIAGIIGGKDSEISSATKRVFLEAAVFNPLLIRRTSRRLGLATEASYRFERQVLPFSTQQAAQEATELILQLGGGKLAATRRLGKTNSIRQKTVKISLSRFNSYMDTAVSISLAGAVLKRLGCGIERRSKDSLWVKLPAHRRDLAGEVDLFEEIARIYGYDRIPSRLTFVNNSAREPDIVRFKRRLKTVSAQAGFREIVSLSLVPEKEAKQLSAQAYVKLANPLRSGENVLRPQLLGGILRAFAYNLNQFQEGLDFFEIADVYVRQAEKVKEEAHYIVGCAGETESDMLHFKGRVIMILSALGIGEIRLVPQESKSFLSAAAVMSGEDILGVMGVSNIAGVKRKKVKAFVFEASLAGLQKASRPLQFKPFPRFPGIKRDISVALKPEHKFAQVEPELRKAGSGMLAAMEVVDFYSGTGLPEGYRGLTIRFYYQHPERTLTAEEVDALHGKIRRILASYPGLILR